VLWRSTSAGPVILRPDADEAERLAGPGAAIWEVLDTPLDLEGLEAAVHDLAGEPLPVEPALRELEALDLVIPE
jgi:hypothetical protein